MGYNTDFDGALTVSPPLNKHERSYLVDFADTRQTSPDHGPLVVQSRITGFIDGNDPQGDKPGIWCHWVTDDEGNLVWDEMEKTYDHAEWLEWIILHLLGPDSRDYVQAHADDDPRLAHFTCDHTVNGVVDAQGEEPFDLWRIKVETNDVQTQYAVIVYPD
ncbi:hypothetical protein [Arthrobacter castelli]|uniref:hypothetical protein n=1 Tax=Arthrobacter castelli TaxID=271431 RepID=UPI000424969E|nr:hypothetical protein [Arthrobacter castelli]